MKLPRVKVNAHAVPGVGFYLFGSTVFGDTSETNKVKDHAFLLH